jgi:hypothetical protein
MKKLVVLATLSLTGLVHAAKWDRSNNPSYFNPIAKNKMNPVFAELPLKGELQDNRFGWSETYWPSNKGGIAFRWNSPNPQPFKYKFFSKEELKAMNENQLSELSPAELYDVAMGDYNYTLTKKVLSKFSPSDLWWEGICHGWSLAAANYPEPAKTVVTNKDGINVPFGSSDVKGLLSMHAAYNAKGHNARVGDRCSVNGKVPGEESVKDGVVPVPTERQKNKAECADVNAGAFHIVLTSMIGINSQGFVADVDRYNDVWNQPVTAYESQIVGEIAPNAKEIKNGVERKIQVKTKMIFGEELAFYTPEEASQGTLGFVSKEPVTGTPAQTFKFKNYEYVLELDRSGNIIGGEWLTETRPDMLWMRAKDPEFVNGKMPLAGLNVIYKPVTH